ncbi:MAG: prenyltransferase [Elusimicrobia bacterium HGW-Elusimicrobia-3]|nr:MAG: prenyltransferase [Elusimicrobia bacterium HGW-Elusimicrobia-3]
MGLVKGLLRLIRPELPVSAGVCTVLGQMFALGALPGAGLAAAAFGAIFLTSGAILVLNDYFDVETDRVNAPQRPIPSGQVSPGAALAFFFALTAGGLALAALTGPATLGAAVLLGVIGFLYNRFFKKSGLPGNLMVSFSVGMTFVYGGLSAGALNRVVLLFAAVAALVELGEEIAADAMDAEGDRLIGSRSLAIVRGRRCALRVSAVSFALVMILTLVPFALGWFAPVYLLPMAVIDGSILFFGLGLLRSSGQEGRAHIRGIYLGATAGLIIFLFMRLAGV